MQVPRRPRRHRRRPGAGHLSRLGAALLALLAWGGAQAEPGRALIQETPRPAAPGRIHIDLINDTGGATRRAPSLVRVGVSQGEWQVSREAIGFKYPVVPALSVYGRVGLDTGAGRSDAVAGLAYAFGRPDLAFNLNPELGKQGDSPHLYLNAAARLPLAAGQAGRLAAILEASLSDEAGRELAIAGGLRWTPRAAVTLDAVLLASGLGNTLGTPVALRLDLAL